MESGSKLWFSTSTTYNFFIQDELSSRGDKRRSYVDEVLGVPTSNPPGNDAQANGNLRGEEDEEDEALQDLDDLAADPRDYELNEYRPAKRMPTHLCCENQMRL